MKVVLLIRSLGIGGAERQVVELARGLSALGVIVRVISFYPGGALRAKIEEAGIPIADLGKRGRWDVFPFLLRLAKTLRRERPDVLYSLLPVANIVAAALKRVVPSMRVVWGVRASNVDLSRYDSVSRASSALEAALSRFADCIVANSEAGRRHYVQKGFPCDRMRVIGNGIDCEYYRFDQEGRARLRAQWSIADDELLIGMSARLDPMKGHETFLHAAAICMRFRHGIRFACVGDGPAPYRKRLYDVSRKLEPNGSVIWAGSRDDMPAVYSAFDILCSASSGEGFSNAIAEAMACERVCVVTDVGDSALIVGETGIVVPPSNPSALAQGIERALAWSSRERHAAGVEARRHIKQIASVTRLIQATFDALRGA
jgi:glycosyltransferase involved in cell wall biosynthesis